MKACDGLDGAEDGVISNVAGCAATFKLASLRCAEGRDTGDDCLSDQQMKSVEAIHSPVSLGLALQGGVSSFPGWPILEGADWTGLFGFGTRPKPTNPPEALKDFGLAVLSDPGVRYMVLRDPTADPLQFDPAKHEARLRELSDLIDASSDDISAFKARGGKLLLMHGTVDSAAPPQNSVDYYVRLVARFGQGPLDDFVRFYVAPGFGHGTGQFIVGWGALGVLENWVERGEAPVRRQSWTPKMAIAGARARSASIRRGRAMSRATSMTPRALPARTREAAQARPPPLKLCWRNAAPHR